MFMTGGAKSLKPHGLLGADGILGQTRMGVSAATPAGPCGPQGLDEGDGNLAF